MFSMGEYNINKCFYRFLIQNGPENNLDRIFYHLVTVSFLVMRDFLIKEYEM